MHRFVVALLVVVTPAIAAPPTTKAPTTTTGAPPLVGTVTYRAVEPDGAATTWTLVTDGFTHRATLDADKRWIGVDGRFVQRGDSPAVVEPGPVFAIVTSTVLPPRTIAGRATTCLRFVPTTVPSADDNAPDRFEACVFPTSTAVPFSIFGGMVDVDVDAAFAERGVTGVPAHAALSGHKGVFSSWTATAIDATPPAAMTKETFLKFAPPLTAKERCLRQIENGPRVVKAAAVALEQYRAETGRYTTDLAAAAFSHSATALYAVHVERIEAGNFEIVADGLGDAVGDQWTMDRSFRAKHTKTAPCR